MNYKDSKIRYPQIFGTGTNQNPHGPCGKLGLAAFLLLLSSEVGNVFGALG